MATISETMVLDARQSFMKVRHLRIEGTNREIGRLLAQTAVSNHGFRLEPAGPTQDITKRRAYFHRHYPALIERSRGIAEALGLPPDDGSVDFTSLGYNMELPPHPDTHQIGCSVVFYPPASTDSRGGILSRNFDFSTLSFAEMCGLPAEIVAASGLKPMMGEPYVLELYPSDGGHATLAMCSFDLLTGALDGINSQGLCVSLMQLLTGDPAVDIPEGIPSDQPVEVGFNEIEIVRFLLDTCGTVDEARRALADAQLYTSWLPCHYLVADAEGRSFVYEKLPGRPGEVLEGGASPLISTNHPLCRPRTSSDDSVDELEGDSRSRYEILRSRIESHSEPFDTGFMKEAAASVFYSSEGGATGTTIGATLWNGIYDLAEKRLSVSFFVGGDTGKHGARYSTYFDFRIEDAQ